VKDYNEQTVKTDALIAWYQTSLQLIRDGLVDDPKKEARRALAFGEQDRRYIERLLNLPEGSLG